MTKSFRVIQSPSLVKILCNKACLVLVDRAIRKLFDCENKSNTNQILRWMWRYQISCFIANFGIKLLRHRLAPVLVLQSLVGGGGDVCFWWVFDGKERNFIVWFCDLVLGYGGHRMCVLYWDWRVRLRYRWWRKIDVV